MDVDRAALEVIIQRGLSHVAANSAYGTLTLASINRVRRDILHAADAYRAWAPPVAAPERPTLTQQAVAAEHRAALALVVSNTRCDPRSRRPGGRWANPEGSPV